MRRSCSSAAAAPVQRDRAHLQHVAAVGHLQRGARVLLHQQHRHAVLAQRRHHLQHLAHDQRRQAERGLVQHQQARAAPSARGRWRASAARRPTAWRPAARGAPCRRGKMAKTSSMRSRWSRSPRRQREKPPSSRLSSTDISPNSSRFSGTSADAARHHRLDAGARDALAAEQHAAARGQQAHRRAQQRGLAGAVGADHGDDLAFVDAQVDAVHRLDRAVGDAEVLRVRAGLMRSCRLLHQAAFVRGLVARRPR